MILSKIQSAIAAYKKWLTETRHHPLAHLWESQRIFLENWLDDCQDPAAMFDASLQNPETRRLWQTENWYPKKMMLEFWRFDPMTVRAMFNDLFNETREAEARVSRFVFGCDLLLADYKKAKPTSIENNHYHADYQMIALYLAFRYPENYAPYQFPVFQKTLTQFQARDIPKENDIGRYFKVQRTLMTFLEKDPGVLAAMQKHLLPRRHFQGRSLLLAFDFCRFVAG